jgi:1,2-diacylglycerol 3-alpha-glucosyltransferase
MDSSGRGGLFLKIVLVVDMYDNLSNGTTMTAYRISHELRKKGHDVRVVAIGEQKEGEYRVRERHIPIVSWVAHKQGMCFGRSDKRVIADALRGADIAHFFLPFQLERKALKIAKKMGVPCSAAFHLQPENITYNIGFGRVEWIARFIYRLFRSTFYHKFEHIHCPSQFIASQLKKHRYQAKLHVISNGVDANFRPQPVAKPDDLQDKFSILMIGRFAAEKRQDVLIRAIAQSKYADRIQLFLAGQGPCEKKLRKLGEKLPLRPVMGFYEKSSLIRLINCCDLYVHASDVEIEAISCIEAFSCGLVPVIADSPKSATPHFALDERSLFEAGNAAALSAKIDYWIEHPLERAAASARYASLGKEYGISHSIEQMEAMFKETISDSHKQKRRKEVQKLIYPFGSFHPFFQLVSFLVYYLIAIPVLTLFDRVLLGLHIRKPGFRRRLRSKGAIVVCNHVHMLDSTMLSTALFPRRVFFTSLQSNFFMPVIGKLIRVLGAVPIPSGPHELNELFDELSKLAQKRIICFYPEGSLIPNCQKLRPFKRGAFMLAVKTGVPILPATITRRDPEGILKLRRQRLTLSLGQPLYPDQSLSEKEAVNSLLHQTEEAMKYLMVS